MAQHGTHRLGSRTQRPGRVRGAGRFVAELWWQAAGAFALSGFLVACGSRVVEFRVALDIELTVLSAEAGTPVAGATIALWDHDLSRTSPDSPLREVCTTDSQGSCRNLVSYRHGASRWPWQKPRSGQEMHRRFELVVDDRGKRVSLGFLPIENSEQVQGHRPIVYSARLQRQ